MSKKFKLLTLSLTTSIMLFIMLCLGSQNLNDTHKIKLGFTSTEPLPSGFIVGISLILGLLGSSGIISEFLSDESNKESSQDF